MDHIISTFFDQRVLPGDAPIQHRSELEWRSAGFHARYMEWCKLGPETHEIKRDGTNVSILCDKVVAIHADMTDKQASEFVVCIAEAVLGPAPIRTWYDTQLLLYRWPPNQEQMYGHSIYLTPVNPDSGPPRRVAVLSDGDSLIVDGGDPFQPGTCSWDRHPLDHDGWAGLTEVNADAIKRFVKSLRSGLLPIGFGVCGTDGVF